MCVTPVLLFIACMLNNKALAHLLLLFIPVTKMGLGEGRWELRK